MRIPQRVLDDVVTHLRGVLPDEGCGLLAVDGSGTVTRFYPITNVEASPVRFTLDPDGVFTAWGDAEAHGWSIGGVAHSHPRSAPVPSRRDLVGAAGRSWIHLIVGLGGGAPDVRAWRGVTGEPVALVTVEP